MRIKAVQISIILITLFVSSCFEPPEFSDIPNVTFHSLTYLNYEAGSDSMILVFDFEDGDGDIGLRSGDEDTYSPYHPFYYVLDYYEDYDVEDAECLYGTTRTRRVNIDGKEKITYDGEVVDSLYKLVSYSDDEITPPLFLVDDSGTLYDFSDIDNRPIYNCANYDEFQTVCFGTDTFYIEKNEYHNNFHIEFQRKRNGVYSKIDFASEFGNTSCDVVDFNGRIPLFDEDNVGRSISGSIDYAMQSAGFPIVLRQDTFRIKFYIYDRALNKSNEVISPDLTLREITIDR